jgi:hypothetical protein
MREKSAPDRGSAVMTLLEFAPIQHLIAARSQIWLRKGLVKSEWQIAGICMRTLPDFRSGKPTFYPDQSVYAEYACSEFELAFRDVAGGTGLLFSVASPTTAVYFGAGRCSFYPQNSATTATLASDKFFTDRILQDRGIPTLGGEYFFLHERHRGNRPPGHERADAEKYLQHLGGVAFVKPLQGSRGDFAQMIDSRTSLVRYLEEVSKFYDAVLMQPAFSGREYRVFLLDDEVIYTARKYPPFVVGDGVRSLRGLLAAHNDFLQKRGLSPALLESGPSPDMVLAKGERLELSGRMNLSAGGTMVLEDLQADAALTLARTAVRALGLRAAAVDLFTDLPGGADPMRVIEVNANPSIRLLEDSDRSDLILNIWHHSFASLGLL